MYPSLYHRFSFAFCLRLKWRGDKEVVRQEASCLGWNEEDLANIALAVRWMEPDTAGARGFPENETLGL